MYYVGMDLAWGERRPTGLAVLDESGHLVHVSAAQDDDEIVERIAPWTSEDCLVAIDAPLIVNNPTGNRACEAALNRDFARFDAGAHPTNMSKPEFAVKPRGARIAARLRLDMNPRSGRSRRAIEVYPHPATVALFRLGRTLKYKQKSGRSLDQVRGELLVLMGLVEGLATASPALRLDSGEGGAAWSALRAAVESSQRKSDVRKVEDQVDAVLCAYIGLYADTRPEATTTYGDFASGYIVTPTLPEGLAPAAREGTRGPVDPGSAVREYAERHPALRAATEEYLRVVTDLLDEAGIDYLTVAARTKSVASFAEKSTRTEHGQPLYPDPVRDIGDQIGLRVITYVQGDVQVVADLLDDQLVVLDDQDLGQKTASEGRFGYVSRHLQVELEEQDLVDHPALSGLRAQVQIRTVLQHAWAQFEHDIRYKRTLPAEFAPDLNRRFTLAAGLLELADREFSTIRDRLQHVVPTPEPAPGAAMGLTARELAAFLAGQYADAGWSRTDRYEWVTGVVSELGIASLPDLGEVLRAVDTETLTRRMGYRYPPGAVRRLDDALLWTYGERYVQLPSNQERAAALRERLRRMRTP